MPWAPSEHFRPELLANGMQSGAQSIAEGFAAMTERARKDNDSANAIQKLFEINPEMQQAAGIDAETFRGLSTKNKIATGMAATAVLHERMQKQQEDARLQQEQATAGLLKERLMDALARRTSEGNMQDAITGVLSGADPNNPPAPLRPGADYSALGNYVKQTGPPAVDGSALANYIAGLGPQPEAAPGRLTPELADRLRMEILKHVPARDAIATLKEMDLARKGAGDGPHNWTNPVTKDNYTIYGNNMMAATTGTPGVTQATDEDGNPIDGVMKVTDRKGNVSIRRIGPGASAEGRTDAKTLADLHSAKMKALERIQGYNTMVTYYAKDPKKYPKPDPSELEDAKADLNQLNFHIRKMDVPAGKPGEASTQVNDRSQKMRTDPSARVIQGKFNRGEITEEQAREAMKKLGY